jgi:hypothetical protein
MVLGSIGTRFTHYLTEDNKFYLLMPFHFINHRVIELLCAIATFLFVTLCMYRAFCSAGSN